MRWHPSVKTHYQALTTQRIQQNLALFTFFQQADLLKVEQYEQSPTKITIFTLFN